MQAFDWFSDTPTHFRSKDCISTSRVVKNVTMRGNSTTVRASLIILPTHLVFTYLNSDFYNCWCIM